MAVTKRWVNVATSGVSSVLFIFALAQTAVTYYMNVTASVNELAKVTVSGATLVALAALVYPTSWVGISAAISRHNGVYIATVVKTSLSILAVIGILVYQCFQFAAIGAFSDVERGVSITMVVLQCILLLILVFLLAFSISALCVRRGPPSPYSKYQYSNYAGYPMPPPVYREPEMYRMSLPRHAALDYPPQPYYSKRY